MNIYNEFIGLFGKHDLNITETNINELENILIEYIENEKKAV